MDALVCALHQIDRTQLHIVSLLEKRSAHMVHTQALARVATRRLLESAARFRAFMRLNDKWRVWQRYARSFYGGVSPVPFLDLTDRGGVGGGDDVPPDDASLIASAWCMQRAFYCFVASHLVQGDAFALSLVQDDVPLAYVSPTRTLVFAIATALYDDIFNDALAPLTGAIIEAASAVTLMQHVVRARSPWLLDCAVDICSAATALATRARLPMRPNSHYCHGPIASYLPMHAACVRRALTRGTALPPLVCNLGDTEEQQGLATHGGTPPDVDV